jgi:shikimate kinase
VLLTGMSGTGKSTLVRELRTRGYEAYDADDDGFSKPRQDGRWGWRIESVADLLDRSGDGLLFFAGCSEEQAELRFDYRVLLTAPEQVLIERLRARTGNSYGRSGRELAQVLADREEIEPLLRRSADLVIATTVPPWAVADELLRGVPGRSASASAARPRPGSRPG